MRGNYRSENEVERRSGQLAPAKDGVGAGFANWRALGGQWGFVCREVQKQIPRSLLRRRSGQAHEGARPQRGDCSASLDRRPNSDTVETLGVVELRSTAQTRAPGPTRDDRIVAIAGMYRTSAGLKNSLTRWRLRRRNRAACAVRPRILPAIKGRRCAAVPPTNRRSDSPEQSCQVESEWLLE